MRVPFYLLYLDLLAPLVEAHRPFSLIILATSEKS